MLWSRKKTALSQKLNQVLSVEQKCRSNENPQDDGIGSRELFAGALGVEVRRRSSRQATILAGKKALVTIRPNDIEQSAAFLETLVDELANKDEIFHTAFLRAADSEAKPWFDKIAKLLQPFCVMPDGNGPAFGPAPCRRLFPFPLFPIWTHRGKSQRLKGPNHHRPEAFRRQVIDRTQELLAFYETWEKNGSAFVPKAIFGTP